MPDYLGTEQRKVKNDADSEEKITGMIIYFNTYFLYIYIYNIYNIYIIIYIN